MSKSKKILITGAAGFIGFHVAERLHRDGHLVVGIDNFNDYYSVNLKQRRAEILRKKKINLVEGDIGSADLLAQLADEHGISHVVHLAAQAGVRYSVINPQAYLHANLQGFLNILELCRHKGLKLTYASSSSIYGNNAKIPFSIEDKTDHPVSFYGATKKANELMAHSYHHLYGIAVTGLRYFTVYGPWGRPDMAYYSFSEAILKGEPLQIYNHGNMRRDFTYIDDIVDGTVAAIHLEAPYEIFNLGNHRPEQLTTFVELIERYLGKSVEKILLPMQPGDVAETYADISHSQERLGFQPKVSLEEGLEKFVTWFLDYHSTKK